MQSISNSLGGWMLKFSLGKRSKVISEWVMTCYNALSWQLHRVLSLADQVTSTMTWYHHSVTLSLTEPVIHCPYLKNRKQQVSHFNWLVWLDHDLNQSLQITPCKKTKDRCSTYLALLPHHLKLDFWRNTLVLNILPRSAFVVLHECQSCTQLFILRWYLDELK